MRKLKFNIMILFLMVAATVSGQDKLNEYLVQAAENNPGLQAKFNEYMASLEVAPQLKALPDPQIAFAYFIQPVETRVGPQEFKISATQMFPWFGTLKAKENVAIQSAKAKYEQFQEAKSKLFNEVSANYFNIYFNHKAITITKENIDLLNTFKNLATIKVEAGIVSAVDEYRIQMEIGDLENQLALLKDNQYVLEAMFNNLLNTDEFQTIDVPADLWDSGLSLTKDEILDSLSTNNHQLLSLSLQNEALSYRKELAKKLGKPSFSIGIDYTFIGEGSKQFAGTDAFIFPKIGITIPLYRSKYKAMVNEVVYLQEAKNYEKNNTENLLETLFEKIWKDYQDSERRVILYKSQLSLAEKSLTLLETDYTTGNKNFEEMLRMERKLLKYNLELEKAKADKQAAISFINYLMGE